MSQQQQNQTNSEKPVQYFAKQEKIYPKRVWGKYRKLKWLAMAITLSIYYLAPFVRWDRGPNAPNQAILIDLENARAYWFWIEIWPQEVYILTGILILSAIALFFITSLFGRVWCGYLCFQTVWTDLFVWVERIIQGDRNARKKLHNSRWSFNKIRKIATTHFLWLIISWFTAGSFVLYFTDAPTLVRSFFELNVSSTVLIFIGSLTFSTYLMAGFAREQVCTYMCPYARFQSAMFDRDTLIIGYDEKRGEKRGKHKKGDSWDNRGHCIDCTACVQVCPTGIDIRNGLQMECIACGLCVDACNDIMDKIDLPRGLIRYDTINHMEAEVKGGKEKFKFWRLRTLYYGCILTLVGTIMLVALITRSPLELHVLHDRNPLFIQLSSGEIRNGYVIKILNKTHEHRSYTLTLSGLEGAQIEVKAAGNINAENLYVPADSVGTYHVFVSANIEPDKPRDLVFTLADGEIKDEYKATFISQRK
ncbi:MAG: cytochrome c oxidase accessory protein CcoG [Micavibrio sp.]|nr:cytochrome c oxidase accessory protein CcoG [Micavibrio sp.]